MHLPPATWSQQLGNDRSFPPRIDLIETESDLSVKPVFPLVSICHNTHTPHPHPAADVTYKRPLKLRLFFIWTTWSRSTTVLCIDKSKTFYIHTKIIGRVVRIYSNLRHISVEWNIRKVIVGVVVEVAVMGWGVIVIVGVRSKDPIHPWHRSSRWLAALACWF